MTALSTMLAETGPLSDDQIAERLRAAGVANPEDVINTALHQMNCPAGQLPDERWIWVPTVVRGRIFTHRVTAEELVHDIVTVTPDLAPLGNLCEHEPHNRFLDGTPATIALLDFDDDLLEVRGIPDEAVPEGGVLVLPPATMRTLGVTAGDLIGIRVDANGFAVERVGTAADPSVGSLLAATLSTEESTFIDAAVWALCLQDDTLFTAPTLPLAEIIAGSGLAHQGEFLAPAGFDFDRNRFEAQCAYFAQRHDIEVDHAAVVLALVAVAGQMETLLREGDLEPAPDEELALGELGAILADPYLAELLVEEALDSQRIDPAALAMLADTLAPQVPPPARVGCQWLRAVALERTGAVQEAEHEYLAAESMDVDWPPTLLDLARFASDRGDAERGVALLHRAQALPDHPLLALLQEFLPHPRPDLGRNEPCWCGSGRKYKKCHLRNERPPLAKRAGWLYLKATQHVLLTGWSQLLEEVTAERLLYIDDSELEGDPLMMDAVLFEGGAFDDFLDARGYLLPDDERLLAEQWLLVQRSVFEVQESRPGDGVTLRDVRTGDSHTVHDRVASREVKPGHLVCARIYPAGDEQRFLGGLEPVRLHERDDLIELLDAEPDPNELVAFLSRRFAPPVLTNTEGHLMVLCEVTLRVSDPVQLSSALDAAYDGTEDNRWLDLVTEPGGRRIRATYTLDRDLLRVETNSSERMDEALEALRRLDPELVVVGESRVPASDIRDLAAQGPSSAETVDPEDPEIAAVLEAAVRAYEASWLDQSIPALHGVTPRQAADDPTRRGDLIKLLDTFPRGTPGTMDVDRLRAALGLER
ncbi:SEC-C domain-containing protein [Mycolicibacterium sp. 120266]|uniref:SEC-C domain-containing protein n=1 Tax=Mycolicibacterium sp. 120266 TaxID=3090601 RepID=UPI00299DCB8C|nr:SEC-C domain-containing protein [Mycolicibacterium sp. 120266]MDX1874533.1 SEC-C domain-containing protein [Mycolicibacterium sp. 120266]